MKRLLPVLLLLCGAMPAVAQKQPIKAIDITTSTNGNITVVFDNNTCKYIERPTAPMSVNTYYSPSQQQTTEPVTATRNSSQSTYTPAKISHQCHVTTKKGAQCKRIVVNGYNCWQHGG